MCSVLALLRMGFRTALLIAIFSAFITSVVNAQSNLTFTNGDSTSVIKFPATGCLYQWKNDNPSIGLVKSGSGDIESFKAVNTGRVPITATISTNPVYEYAYISNFTAGTVTVYNTVTASVMKVIQVGDSPQSVLISPDASTVYLTNVSSTNTIDIINTSTNTLKKSIAISTFANDLAISPDGATLYASSLTAGIVSVIDTKTYQVKATFSQSNAAAMIVSKDGSKLYVVDNATGVASIFETTGFTKIGSLNFLGGTNDNSIGYNSFIQQMVLSPDGNEIYAKTFGNTMFGNAILIADLTTNGVTGQVGVGYIPAGITLSKNGKKLYVATYDDKKIVIIDPTTRKQTDIIQLDAEVNSVSLNSDESKVYALNYKAGTITVINTVNGEILYKIPIGTNPVGGTNFIADFPGCALPGSFTITVNPSPTAIIADGYINVLTTLYGTPSVTTSFLLSGTNLGEGILATAPAGFEISTDSLKFSKTLLVGAAGNVAPRKIYVRLAATANAGSYNDIITLTSTGATAMSVTVNGTVSQAVLTITSKHLVKFYGTVNPELVITYSGFKNKDGPNQLTTLPVVSTLATTTSAVGVYPITVSGASSPNYTLVYVENTLDIATGLQFPNTFTPNNDGVNDLWTVKYIEAYPKASVQIFNRYGNKVYYSQENFTSWDGRFNGTDLPVGTYYYIISPNNGTKPISGPVSIIR